MTMFIYMISFVWPFQFLPTMVLLIITLLFLVMLVQNRIVVRRVKKYLADTHFTGNMMEEAVKISDNNVVRFVIREKYIEHLYTDTCSQRMGLPPKSGKNACILKTRMLRLPVSAI